MNIILSNSSGKPIYEQIADQVKEQVLTGALAAGDALPSMRLLAKELRISVITTKRAYEELERDGFIQTVAGKGSFVSTQTLELAKESGLREIEEHLQAALDLARQAGMTVEELQQILQTLNEEE